MSALPITPVRLVALLGVASLAACSAFGDRPVVRFGSHVLTLENLRTAYADLDPQVRPSLATREGRDAFVEHLVERLLLDEEGRRLLRADARTAAREAEQERQGVLVRRLRVLEVGETQLDSSAVAAAYQRMGVAHHVEIFYFRREEDARAAKEQLAAGARDLPGVPHMDGWIQWSPFPDPVADAVVDLPLGMVAGPLRVGGGWRLARVSERRPGDPGPLDQQRPHILQALRSRRESEATEALAERLRAAQDVRVDSAAVSLLAARTRVAILQPGSTEQDDAWAIPALTAEEDSTRVATWRDGALSAGDYLDLLRRQSRAQRPRAMLDAEIRWVVDQEITARLLFGEAERRALGRDRWVVRALERSQQDRAVQRAVQEIERATGAGDSALDSLAARLHETRPELFQRASRARVLRFDLASAEAGRAEVESIRRAGGPEARLREILDGDAPPSAPYHLLYVTPAEMPSPAAVTSVFAAGPGAVAGPLRQGDVWVVFACLAVQAPTAPTREEVLAQFRTQTAESGGTRRLAEWLERRKHEVNLRIDAAALDALAPGG
ncbi:MAG: peptidylprolyl isomerase [bacterium]